MRMRLEAPTTGRVLAYFDPERRASRSRGFYWAVTAVADVDPLQMVERCCREIVRDDPRFEWFAATDLATIAEVDERLQPGMLNILEPREFAGFATPQLERLLRSAIERLRSSEAEIFPSAGGAAGFVSRGVHFLGREDLVERLHGLLATGQNVLLAAPRRSGKTSVLHRLLSRQGLRCVYVEAERARSLRHFAALIRARLLDEPIVEAIARTTRPWHEEIHDLLHAQPTEPPVVLLLDELVALFLDHAPPSDADSAADLLRKLDYAGVGSRVRVVVAGSMDLLDYLEHERGLAPAALPGWVSSLSRIPLGPLDDDGVDLRRLLIGTGLVLEPHEIEWLHQAVDLSLPYPARVFIEALAVEARTRPRERSPADLEAFLDRWVEEGAVFDDIDKHLRDRARRVSGFRERVEAAVRRLDVGRCPLDDMRALLGGAENLRWLIETLPVAVDDGTGQASLPSKLFRRWWHRVGGVGL